VTLFLLDVASYQGPLATADVVRAGFGAVNLKISHGLSRKSVHPDVAGWVDRARAAKLGICTFHYFTADAGGVQQADYAYERIAELGLAAGTAHQLDVECDPVPPVAEVIAYLERITKLLGRRPVLYTGDWWWRPRGWDVSEAAPYLWAAPNVGYLGAYPGDNSLSWEAGYGGWRNLAIMQFAVQPLTFPDGTRGTINVSKSAIRDLAVWRTLTGEVPVAWQNTPASESLLAEFNAVGPKRSKASDGTVGDLAHQQSVSDHNPDETGNTGSASDPDHINEVHARDVTAAGPWPTGWTMERFVQVILARCRSGAEKRLRYIIFNKRIWSESDGWVQHVYAGENPHDKHAHFSFKYGSGSGTANPENITTPWGLLAAVEEDDMPTAKEIGTEVVAQIKTYYASAKQSDGTPTSIIGRLALDQGIPNGLRAGAPRDFAWAVIRDLGVALAKLQATADAILKNEVGDDADLAAIRASIEAAEQRLTAAIAGVPSEVLDALAGGTDQQIADALKTLFGARTAAIAARMAA
jgi:hypothetical protein